MAHDVFISHSSADKQAADNICCALETNGVKCWIAPRDVTPGAEYAGELTNAIKNSKLFLLIFSEESNKSGPVSREIETAFRYEKTVIPFRIEQVELRESLQYYLSNLHWLDARPNDSEHVELVTAVRSALGIAPEPQPAVAAAPASPSPNASANNVCTQCGVGLSDGARFCTSCGAPQPAPPQPAPPQPAAQYTPPQPAAQYTPRPAPAKPSGYAPSAPAPNKSSKLPIIIGSSVLGVAAVIVILMLTVFSDKDPAPPADDRSSQRAESALDDSSDAAVTKITTAPIDNEAPAASDSPLTGAEVFDNCKNAVFQILMKYDDGSGGWGSGFFVDATGVAVTNHHVMDGATSATAILFDGREFPVTGYYTYDENNDWAVIQVGSGGGNFDVLTIGDPASVKVGDSVYAIGGPEGDPLTFTQGIISRLVSDPIYYDMYSISGMFQTTAFIYGGNSGGPLVNDRARVIGINSAARTDIESQQWAVPVNRVDIPDANRVSLNPLPIITFETAFVAGQITTYNEYPFIPDFLSVSPSTSLLIAGSTEDLEFYTEEFDYSFLYIYTLPSDRFWEETGDYDDVLYDYGFMYQDDLEEVEDSLTVYFYNPDRDVSLSYYFDFDEEFLMIIIGHGDAYTAFYGSSGDTPAQRDHLFIGYERYPNVPDFASISPNATLIGGYDATDTGYYQYVYYYNLPFEYYLDETNDYDNFLEENGFTFQGIPSTGDDDTIMLFFYSQSQDLSVNYLYSYEDEAIGIFIGTGDVYSANY